MAAGESGIVWLQGVSGDLSVHQLSALRLRDGPNAPEQTVQRDNLIKIQSSLLIKTKLQQLNE